MDNKRNVKTYSIPLDETVDITISGKALRDLKYVYEAYMRTANEQKQMAAMLFISGVFEAKMHELEKNEAERERKVKELNAVYGKDSFVFNALTLATFIGVIEQTFAEKGKAKEKEIEVNFSSESIAKFYDEQLKESKKKD
jgi:hypothetical protein